jgi:predicted nucleic acid-binding Zn ribbon protein
LQESEARRDKAMSNIFYIIGVVVVIVAILGFLGLR